MARFPRLQWRIAVGMVTALAAGGCVGLSVPLGELTASAPAITGSIKSAWPLPRPLPASLAPSDATAMGEAVRRALSGAEPQPAGEWANPATGSSGTLVLSGEAEEEGGEICHTYASTVTSIRGVHRYACRACRTSDGRVTIRSIEAAGVQPLAAAGI